MARSSQVFGVSFFDRPADRVARDLVGQWLVVRGRRGPPVRHLVCETEAYLGAHDLACHGSRGMTPRNATMFGPAGRWYVYLCYGMHWMLNVVTGAEGVPAAVLIRGVAGHVGPGRLTRALGIDRSLDGTVATPRGGLWFEGSGIAVPRRLVARTPRIGIGSAGAWAEKPLRFVADAAALSCLVEPGRREEAVRVPGAGPAGRHGRGRRSTGGPE